MKSLACISSSVRAACQPACPVNRAVALRAPADRCSGVDFAGDTVSAQRPCATAAVRACAPWKVRTAAAAAAQQVSAARTAPAPRPHTAAPLNLRSVFEGGLIPELCCRLARLPSSDRAEGLAALLGACAEPGPGPRSGAALRLTDECLALLSGGAGAVRVAQLCRLGEAACALHGRRSALVTRVLACVGAAVGEGAVTPGEAAGVYSLLALCHDPAGRQQTPVMSTLHGHTQRLVHRLRAGQVSHILQSLLRLQQRQAISLVLRLSHRASRVFKAFSDGEVIKVLSALVVLGQHDDELLAAMEKHLPGRLGECDPELISTVMEYCLQMRCRSEPIFEAVAENFVLHAERHTTLQVAKQIVAMARLNYLPQCSSQMFKKLECILSTRFSQFQPRSLIEVLHACIHLERFPLNYISKVFSPYFLQRLQAQGEPLDKNAMGQLTQLHLSTSLECTHYRGPRLPYFFYVKRFSTVGQAFETPMESLFYKQVKGPLTQLLGGKFYSTRIFTHSGYTIDVEICLDENGYILPPSQWDHTYRRMALCLDGENRFCSNTQHLLGKEATKRRHLRSMGYELVQIPYFEFEKLRTQEEQVQYLHDKIFPTIFKFKH